MLCIIKIHCIDFQLKDEVLKFTVINRGGRKSIPTHKPKLSFGKCSGYHGFGIFVLSDLLSLENTLECIRYGCICGYIYDIYSLSNNVITFMLNLHSFMMPSKGRDLWTKPIPSVASQLQKRSQNHVLKRVWIQKQQQQILKRYKRCSKLLLMSN